MDLGKFEGNVGFIGAGNMASALARGFLRAGLEPARIQFFDPDPLRCREFAELGCQQSESEDAVASSSSVVIVAVKPALVALILGKISKGLSPLWVSVAAGITTHRIESALGGEPRVIRAMPNTGALALASATAIVKGQYADEHDRERAELLMATVGSVVLVSESQMNAVTGLSGSGPAYVMMFIEALADGGVQAGLPRDVALRLATETVRGSATLLAETRRHPALLKDQVASPGGTTIAGIAALESLGFRAATMRAVAAATERAEELSRT